LNRADTSYTYSTIGIYRQAFFAGLPHGNPQGIKAPLAPLLRAAMDNRQVTAEIYTGAWTDVGTPERLAQLDASR
jgi:MurNAc alpha-1-phosphate uridylyltransferase